jgi:molybdopterin molybdotransferase
MLPAQEAEAIILSLVQPFEPQRDIEVVDLSVAIGRILATSVTSQLDFPHWDNSAMDGYAVRYADVQSCNSEHPAVLEIVEEIPAGKEPQVIIQPRQAARIFTGACMPQGADTVVMQECTRQEDNRVFILEAPKPQAFVRYRGSFYQAGMPLLEPGIVLNAPEIAILAAAQCTQLNVYRRPKVAILSTGNELVSPEQPLQPGQIVDSNQYALAAWVSLAGGISKVQGIVRDEPKLLKDAITQAIPAADVILSTGGVSVGEYDYVDRILAQLGADIHIRSVAVKPGKPLTVATLPSKSGRWVLYFGLPGNPVSALVSCWRFVQPALCKLSGMPPEKWKPMRVQARSQNDLRSDGRRETYFWGRLQLDEAGVYEFHLPGGSQNSGNLINLAQTTGLAVVPMGQTSIAAGESVQVLQVS